MGQVLGDGLGLWARPMGQQKRARPREQGLIFEKLFPSWANGLVQAMGQGLGDGLDLCGPGHGPMLTGGPNMSGVFFGMLLTCLRGLFDAWTAKKRHQMITRNATCVGHAIPGCTTNA